MKKGIFGETLMLKAELVEPSKKNCGKQDEKHEGKELAGNTTEGGNK